MRFDTRIFKYQASSLATRGYETFLIVADGKGNETKSGVNILDVGKKNGRFARFFVSTVNVYLRARQLDADIYHFHDPELIFFGLLLKIRGKHVVYDIHENLSIQILHKSWIPRFLRIPISKAFEFTESIACRMFDALCVPQPTMQKKYRTVNKETRLIANFVRCREFSSIESNAKKHPYNVVYAGGLSQERGLFSMLDASLLFEDATLVLAGGFDSKETEQRARTHPAWERIEYLGLLTHEEILQLYTRSSLGLILYHNVGQYYLSFAIKLFEYMERSIAVVMPDFGEWIEFNRKTNCGVNVDVSNHHDIANVVNELLRNREFRIQLGASGRKAVEQKYNWKIMERELDDLYRGMLSEQIV